MCCTHGPCLSTHPERPLRSTTPDPAAGSKCSESRSGISADYGLSSVQPSWLQTGSSIMGIMAQVGHNDNTEPDRKPLPLSAHMMIPATPPHTIKNSSYEGCHSCRGEEGVLVQGCLRRERKWSDGRGKAISACLLTHGQEAMGIQVAFWYLKSTELWGAS